jgi:general stress protein 26
MATVRPDGEPHLAMVSPGFFDDLVVVTTSAASVKTRNLRAGSGVMLHWIVREETGDDMLLVRGEPRLVDDARRRRELWASECMPYALADYYLGPDDPDLAWVEIAPTYASLHRNMGADGREVWRR